MPYEKMNCAGCGAPISAQSMEGSVICTYCSTRNIIKQDQKGAYTAVDARLIDLLAKEAGATKFQRAMEATSKAMEEARQTRDRELNENQFAWDKAKRQIEKDDHSLTGGEAALGCSGYAVWGIGIVLIIVFLIQGRSQQAFFIVLPIGFVLGFLLQMFTVRSQGKRGEDRRETSLKEIDAQFSVMQVEIENRYAAEAKRLEEALKKIEMNIKASQK